MKYPSRATNAATETEHSDYTIDFLMFKTMNFIFFRGKSLYVFSVETHGSNKLSNFIRCHFCFTENRLHHLICKKFSATEVKSIQVIFSYQGWLIINRLVYIDQAHK